MESPRPWTKPDPLPGPVRTGRLVVRWYEPGDAQALFAAVCEDRETLLPWLPWAASDHRTLDESIQRIDYFARERSFVEATTFTMAIFERESGALLGGTGFGEVLAETAQADIGYWIRAAHRRKGLCAEAVGALLTSAFDDWGFRRIRIRCATPNTSSRAVVEKLGLRLEAVERGARWIDALGWTDQLSYAVLAEEWDREARRGPGGGVREGF